METSRPLTDRYHLASHIARGGMATVYRAVDRRLDRTVALKVLKPQFAGDADFEDRFRREAATGNPLILCVHIPLHAPGRSVGFGCGHPEWGAATDKNHRIERRPIWPERHSAVTMDFHREVFSSPHLLGIFAGHIHRLSTDVLHGVPQVVAGANATGAHLVVEVLPREAPEAPQPKQPPGD